MLTSRVEMLHQHMHFTARRVACKARAQVMLIGRVSVMTRGELGDREPRVPEQRIHPFGFLFPGADAACACFLLFL
jgi:hypothetical protein